MQTKHTIDKPLLWKYSLSGSIITVFANYTTSCFTKLGVHESKHLNGEHVDTFLIKFILIIVLKIWKPNPTFEVHLRVPSSDSEQMTTEMGTHIKLN